MSKRTLNTEFAPDRSTDFLFKSLILIAVVSICAILSLTCFGSYKTYSRYIIMNAENDSVQISEALLSHESNFLFKGDSVGNFSVSLSPAEIPILDSRLREFLWPFGIVKVKIYNDERKIIYSTDSSIIGKLDQKNLRLAKALVGFNDSKLERADKIKDLTDEHRIGIDVVESYIPIRDTRGRIIGAFEIYMDVSKYQKDILNVVLSTSIVLLAVLLLVFSCSFMVIKKIINRLKRTEAELHRAAVTDSLTGIANRRQIVHRINEEFARLVRKMKETSDYPGMSFVMMDIDNFKMVNDIFGHLTGDIVLKEVVERIVHALRQYDVVGRFGGEEFLVMLPETDLDEAWRVAERIRVSVGEESIIIDSRELKVTASFGIACVKTGEMDYESALKRADKGLYKAKDAGRNQVACVDDN